MKTRSTALRTGRRATRAAAATLLALSALGASTGASLAAPGGTGSIWTTNDPCTELAAQNTNEYAIGETVHVRGANFTASTAVEWTVTGLPGGASGDPHTVVASGAGSSDGDGGFCLAAYVVAADDWGVYTVDVKQGKVKKNDNYHVAAGSEPATEPGDEDPGDESPTNASPTDESPTDETPADETPADSPRDEPGECSCFGEPANGGTNNSGTNTPATTPTQSVLGATSDSPAATSSTAPLTQAVLGEISTGGSIELPATDTVTDVPASDSSLLLIVGLATLAGAAVLFTPSRRRESDATE